MPNIATLFAVGLGVVVSAATPALPQYRPEQTVTISPQAMDPRLGNIEIELSNPEFVGVIVVQRTPRDSSKPDAWSVIVPNPWDSDQSTGLYCHFSYEEGAYMQMYFIDGTAGRPIPMSDDARKLMRELADQVRTFLQQTGIKANNIGLGIVREAPNSFFGALERIRKAVGGCNYKSVMKTMPRF